MKRTAEVKNERISTAVVVAPRMLLRTGDPWVRGESYAGRMTETYIRVLSYWQHPTGACTRAMATKAKVVTTASASEQGNEHKSW